MSTDRRNRDLIDLAVQIAQEDAKTANSIGFLSRIFCQCALPHREPQPDPRTGQAPAEWIRKNGSITMRLRPGISNPGRPDERSAYAYGVLPRYLLIWITTVVARDDDSALLDDGLTIDLGGSMRSFLRQIGIQTATGGKNGSATRLRDQVTRLATSTVTLTTLPPYFAAGVGCHPLKGELAVLGGMPLYVRERRDCSEIASATVHSATKTTR